MKKIISACVAAILSLSLLNAQGQDAEAISVSEENDSSQKRSIMLGVTAGFNMTTFSSDFDPKMGPGAQIGINCDIPVSKYISIMPELIFAYKTVKVNDLDGLLLGLPEINNEKVLLDTKDRLLYMDVPVNVKGSCYYGIGRPFISVGPMLSVGLYGQKEAGDSDSKILLFQGDTNPDFPFSAQEKPLYRNVDFSVNFKIGYDFDFGLSAALGFQLGLVNMWKFSDEAKDAFKVLGMDTPSQKSRTFFIALGYNF